MAHVQRYAALARILVVELAAHIRVRDPLEGRRRLLPGFAAADRRHRGHAGVGMALQLHLEAFRPKGAHEAGAAGGGQKPGEVENADAVEGEGLAALRGLSRPRRVSVRRDLGRRIGERRLHARRVFVQQRSAAPRYPAGRGGDPFARRIAERLIVFRMLDIADAPARDPVRVEGVLVRLAQRRPEHAEFLRLPPRHVLVGEVPHEPLHGFHALVALLLDRAGPRHETSAFREVARLLVHAGFDAVTVEQFDQPVAVSRPRAEAGHDPAPVFRVGDGRVRRDGLARVAAGLAKDRRAPHDPGHEVDFGALGDRLVHCAGDLLPLPGAKAVNEGGHDRHAHLLSGHVIGVPHLRRDRRQIVFAVRCRVVAAIHHDAAERQMHQIGGLVVAPGAGVAKGCDTGMDERGKPSLKALGVQPQRIERALGR